MDFETFKENLARDVKERLDDRFGGDTTVEARKVEKMNESYDALTVKPEDSDIGVNLNVNSLYASHQDGMDYDTVVDKAVNVAANALDAKPEIDVAAISDYEKMKQKLSMEVVSAERNAEMLENIPHKNIEDMAIVYRLVLDSSEEGRSSILLTNKMLDNYGITAEQLHNDAMEIAPEIRPAVIKGMSEVMAEMIGVEQAEMMGLSPAPDEPMYVATVPDKMQGASVLAYQDFMDQAAEKLGGEYLGLRWEDIDFENKMLEINHTIAYYPTDGTKSARMRIHLPKTDAGIRTIPILHEVIDALLMAKEEQEEEEIEQPILDGMTGFVFLNRYGDVMNPQSVNNGIKRIIASYNSNEELEAARERREPFFLDKFTCHVLRHTFATRLCMACSNVKIIQSIMGHKDVSTTFEIYAEATDDAKKNAFDILSEEFSSLF